MKKLNNYILEKFKISKDIFSERDYSKDKRFDRLSDKLIDVMDLYANTQGLDSDGPDDIWYSVLCDLIYELSDNFEDRYFNNALLQFVSDFKKELENN